MAACTCDHNIVLAKLLAAWMGDGGFSQASMADKPP